jgi:hypothetical protein
MRSVSYGKVDPDRVGLSAVTSDLSDNRFGGLTVLAVMHDDARAVSARRSAAARPKPREAPVMRAI